MSVVEPVVFIAVQIGCLECGMNSSIIGVFWHEEDAKKACEENAQSELAQNMSGSFSNEVFEATLPA